MQPPPCEATSNGDVNKENGNIENTSERPIQNKQKPASDLNGLLDLQKLLDEIEFSSLNIGDKWFLISLAWWKKLTHAMKNGFIEDITPIDNSKISAISSDGKFYLRQNLIEKIDYIPVPERVFEALKSKFGLENEDRDVLRREVIRCTLRKIEIIEIYPRILTVCLARDRTKSKEFTLENETLGELRSRVLKEMDLADVVQSKLRFYIVHEEGGIERTELLQIADENDHVGSILSTLHSKVLIDVVSVTGDGFIRPRQDVAYSDDVYNSGTASYERGVCGLQNLGNTCFMNSALQCLSNVPSITQYFLTDRYLNDINEENPLGTQGHLARAYGTQIHIMWSGRNSCFVPRNLKQVIGKFAPRFSGFSQQDSQELLAFLLDGLHEDLNRVKKKPYVEEEENSDGKSDAQVADRAWDVYKMRNDSIIVDKVHGQLRSTLVCPACNKVSIKFDPFCFLSLPVPPKDKTSRVNVIVIFNPAKKWAKFSVTVARSTTVEEVTNLIRKQLTMDSDLLLFSSEYDADNITVLSPSSPIVQESRFRLPDLFAIPLKTPFQHSDIVMVRAMKATGTRSSSCLPMFFTIPKGHPTNDEYFDDFISQEVIVFFKETYLKDASSEEEAAVPKVIVNDERTENNRIHITLEFESSALRDYRGSDLVEREVAVPLSRKEVHLNDCLSLFTRQEQLSEQDSWYCPQCKEHVRATKKLDLWRLPETLIVHLKRFQYSRWNREKIDTNIIIPRRDFSLNNFLANHGHEECIYDLCAVSHHMGGLGGGHYTATALNGTSWYSFNDSCASQCAPPCDPHDGQSPYMLFYRRRQPPSPIHSDVHLEMEVDD